MQLLLLLSLLSLSLSLRKVIITGGTGVLGNALVKVLLSSSTSSSSSVPTSVYVGYRDIIKVKKLYENEPIFLKYFKSNSKTNSNSNNIRIFPTYINLDDDIDISFLGNDNDNSNNNDDDNEVILINNAAVYMNGNDHDVMIKSLKYNCIEPGITISLLSS